jgi:hypothetical protein
MRWIDSNSNPEASSMLRNNEQGSLTLFEWQMLRGLANFQLIKRFQQ